MFDKIIQFYREFMRSTSAFSALQHGREHASALEMDIGVETLGAHAHLLGQTLEHLEPKLVDLARLDRRAHHTPRFMRVRAVVESATPRRLDHLGEGSRKPTLMPYERETPKPRGIGDDTTIAGQLHHHAGHRGVTPRIVTRAHRARLKRLMTKKRIQKGRFAGAGLVLIEVFLLPPEETARFVAAHGAGLAAEQVQGLYLNVQYENHGLTCITGVSLNVFSMDRTLEREWDQAVREFLKKNGVAAAEA